MTPLSVKEFAEKMCHSAGIVHRGTDLPREDVVHLMLSYGEWLLSDLLSKVDKEWEEAEKPSPRAEYLLIVSLWLKRELADLSEHPGTGRVTP